MTLYIALIASLNLCLGYALGVYIGVMPGKPRRGLLESPVDEPIGLDPAAADRSDVKAGLESFRTKLAALKSDSGDTQAVPST